MSATSSGARAPVVLRPLYCPVASAINPEIEAIEADCAAWVDRFQLYGSDEQRERLLGTRAAEIYARALPTAPAQRVADVAKWLYWGFATDDLLYDNGPTSKLTRDFLTVGAPLVRLSEEPRATFAWEPPYSDALRDLVIRVRGHATPAQWIEWGHTARAWFFGMAWDVANAERGAPPSLNDYLMMRMHTGGLASWATTLNIANGVELSPEQAVSGPVRAITEAWSTFCLLLNDLMSYAKETRNGDNSSNIITVVAHERGVAPAEAVGEAQAICDRIATLYVALRDQLARDADDALGTYLAGLDHTWRGIVDWGFTAPRYMQGDGPDDPLQAFPGWADRPSDDALEPLAYGSVAWWWDEVIA